MVVYSLRGPQLLTSFEFETNSFDLSCVAPLHYLECVSLDASILEYVSMTHTYVTPFISTSSHLCALACLAKCIGVLLIDLDP